MIEGYDAATEKDIVSRSNDTTADGLGWLRRVVA
jgi:hypothetical protein